MSTGPTEEKRIRHGSPTFYSLLEEMAQTHDKKSHDYASNDNPSGNYHFAGQMACIFSHSPQDAGFFGCVAEKIYRLANLEKSRKIAKNETIEDTERDIVTIIALWISDRRDRRNKNKDYIDKMAKSISDKPFRIPKAEEFDIRNPDHIKARSNAAVDQIIKLYTQLTMKDIVAIADFFNECKRDIENSKP